MRILKVVHYPTAEDPEVPARFLVPLIREIPNDSKPLFGMMGIQPKAVTYLTPAKAYSQIFRVSSFSKGLQIAVYTLEGCACGFDPGSVCKMYMYHVVADLERLLCAFLRDLHLETEKIAGCQKIDGQQR